MRHALGRKLLVTLGMLAVGLPGVLAATTSAALALPPSCTRTGNIQVENASTNAVIGFVSRNWNSFGEFGTTTTPADYLSVSVTSGTSTDITALNGLNPAVPFVGGIVGFANTSDNLAVGSYNYAYLGGTAQTPPGSTPATGANEFTILTGIPEHIESAIWTLQSNTVLTAQWINTDSSRPVTHIMDITNILVLTGDPTAFQNQFGPAPEVALNFVTSTLCQTTISTQASAGGPLGTALTDTATLTGGSPTGNVVFKLFSDNTCATQVGATSTKALSGLSATSDPITPTSPGSYWWTAVYSGDANNNGATSACLAANESAVITKASPTISTQASAGGPLGTAVTDTATLAGGSSPTGTVVFKLFSDNTCATQVGATSTKTLSGLSATSDPITPTAPGTYWWTAVYGGDANNNGVTSACLAPNESVTVAKASPTIATQASPGNLLGAPVRDVATVAGGFSPTGSVVFKLFSDNTCATQVFTSTNNLPSPVNSDWFTPTAAGTYWWTAVYGGDANNNGATSACLVANESVVIAPFVAPAPTRTITGDLVGPVTVGNGESVLITNARVVGPVTVSPGGALSIVNSQISRGITVDNPSFLSICGSSVSGPSPAQALGVSNAAVPIRIGDPSNVCAGNRFAGDVNLTSNLAVTFGANIVSNNVNINSNGPGNTVIKANNIYGALACTGNNPLPTSAGQTNTAGSKTGQCTSL